MQKYGSPEPLRPVEEPAEQATDPQGINTTALRQEPPAEPGEILEEGTGE